MVNDNHFNFEFADTVIIRENIGNIKVGDVSVSNDGTAEVSVRNGGDTTLLDFVIPGGMDGKNGVDGKDGENGKDGTDGFSPSVSVSKIDDTTTITITDKNGTTTATVKDGKAGVTPKKYITAISTEDIIDGDDIVFGTWEIATYNDGTVEAKARINLDFYNHDDKTAGNLFYRYKPSPVYRSYIYFPTAISTVTSMDVRYLHCADNQIAVCCICTDYDLTEGPNQYADSCIIFKQKDTYTFPETVTVAFEVTVKGRI